MSMYNIKNFVLFGDSITEFGYRHDEKGWVMLLADKYVRKIDIINRGFSGYNTKHALEIFPKIFNKERCQDTLLMTLFFGANDAGVNVEQMLPEEEYVANMRQLIHLCLETFPEHCPVIVITPPPCYSKKFNEYRGVYKHENKRTEEFRNLCLGVLKEFADHPRVYSIDIWEDILGSKTWEVDSEAFDQTLLDYVSDGLHLNDRGNEILYRRLVELIDEKLPHLSADRLCRFGPYWREFSPDNITEVFKSNFETFEKDYNP